MKPVRHKNTVRLEELQGIFWPVEVYKRVKKTSKIPSSMAIQEMEINGVKRKGVILTEDHGRPVGSVNIYSEDIKYVAKDRTLLFEFAKRTLTIYIYIIHQYHISNPISRP